MAVEPKGLITVLHMILSFTAVVIGALGLLSGAISPLLALMLLLGPLGVFVAAHDVYWRKRYVKTYGELIYWRSVALELERRDEIRSQGEGASKDP